MNDIPGNRFLANTTTFYTCVQRARLLDVSGVLLRGELVQEQAVRDMHGTKPK